MASSPFTNSLPTFPAKELNWDFRMLFPFVNTDEELRIHEADVEEYH